MAIQIGDRVRDLVTGYEGVAIAVTVHITGCRTVGVVSGKQSEDGRLAPAEWFDDKRLTVVQNGAVQFVGMNTVDVVNGDGAGPNPTVK